MLDDRIPLPAGLGLREPQQTQRGLEGIVPHVSCRTVTRSITVPHMSADALVLRLLLVEEHTHLD